MSSAFSAWGWEAHALAAAAGSCFHEPVMLFGENVVGEMEAPMVHCD